MKMKIAVLAIIFCLMSTTAAFSRGGHGGHMRGVSGGHHVRSGHSGIHGGHHKGAEIAFGVLGGLLLGSALLHAATPPPRTVIYGAPHGGPYKLGGNARNSRICMEDRVVNGQWQTSRYDGRRVWVQFRYPVTKRFRVPCH